MHSEIKLSERLTELMEIRGLTNAELASEINVSSVSISRWKKGTSYILFSNCLKLANYFNCSLDFLVGRSETLIDFTPKSCPPFYSHFRALIKKLGISRNKINRETSIKSSHFVDWKNGSDPNVFSLIELADYLDITIDCLVGRDS